MHHTEIFLRARKIIATFLKELRPDMDYNDLVRDAAAVVARLAQENFLICEGHEKTLSALELAKQLKKDDQIKAELQTEAAKNDREFIVKEKARFAKMITDTLHSFDGAGFGVVGKWFAGADYWVLKKDAKELLSCVLTYEKAVREPLGDRMTYEGWEILVCEGDWNGPHGPEGVAGFDKEEEVAKEVARIMKDYV